MLWYGSNRISYQKIFNNYINYKAKTNYKLKNFRYEISIKFNKNLYFFNFFLPLGWDFIILNNKLHKFFYIYNNCYYFFFLFNEKIFKFNYNIYSNNLIFVVKYFNIYYKSYSKFINSFFNSFNRLFFKKIKFQGKAYRLYKSWRNTIVYQFGHSHRIYLFCYLLSLKLLSKFSILIFGINWKLVNLKSYELVKWRYINIFTSRGLRFFNQIIYKKEGKISSYR